MPQNCWNNSCSTANVRFNPTESVIPYLSGDSLECLPCFSFDLFLVPSVIIPKAIPMNRSQGTGYTNFLPDAIPYRQILLFVFIVVVLLVKQWWVFPDKINQFCHIKRDNTPALFRLALCILSVDIRHYYFFVSEDLLADLRRHFRKECKNKLPVSRESHETQTCVFTDRNG